MVTTCNHSAMKLVAMMGEGVGILLHKVPLHRQIIVCVLIMTDYANRDNCLFAAVVPVSNAGKRQIEIASGSLKGNLFGKREDYSYDVPEGVVHVSLSKEDKSEGAISIGSGTGDVSLKWDKAAKKAYVHAWVNGSVGSNHVTWTIYGWV